MGSTFQHFLFSEYTVEVYLMQRWRHTRCRPSTPGSRSPRLQLPEWRWFHYWHWTSTWELICWHCSCWPYSLTGLRGGSPVLLRDLAMAPAGAPENQNQNLTKIHFHHNFRTCRMPVYKNFRESSSVTSGAKSGCNCPKLPGFRVFRRSVDLI